MVLFRMLLNICGFNGGVNYLEIFEREEKF